MSYMFYRKYNEATTLDIALYDLSGVNLKVDATIGEGDMKISKDEGAEADTTNSLVDEGRTYSLALTASEMSAKRIVVSIIDQDDPKVFLDEVIIIETFGHANAMYEAHPADVVKINGGLTNDNIATLKLKALSVVNNAGNAITAASTGANGNGIYALGDGNGAGLNSSGGASGSGIKANGNGAGEGINAVGGTSGAGIYAVGAAGITAAGLLAAGLRAVSNGANPGAEFEGGATGNGVEMKPGSTSGSGLKVTGKDSSPAVNIEHTDLTGPGIFTRGSDGIQSFGSANGHGILANGIGAGSGIMAKGGNTGGKGIYAEGGDDSGEGFLSQALNANSPGIKAVGNGTGADIEASELSNIESKVDTSLTNQTNIENKVDTSLSNQATIEGKIDIIDVNVDAALLNQVTIEGKIDLIDSNVDTVLTNQTSIEGKIDLIDLNIDTVLTNQTSIEGKIDLIDSNVDIVNGALTAIIAKLPSGTISDYGIDTLIDGIPAGHIMELIMAIADGRILKDSPEVGDLTIFRRDNTTILTITRTTESERTRL